MTLQTRPCSSGIGVEVSGLDIETEIPGQIARKLRELWLDAGLLVFREAGTSPEALLNLSRCFGELEPHPIAQFRLPGYEELILLSNENGLTGPVYDIDGVHTYGHIPWHTDLAFATTPNAGALLRMVKRSEHDGQTGWTDTALAWESLDEAMKSRIEGLEARYTFSPDLESMRFNKPRGSLVSATRKKLPSYPPVAHPLVWVHPETGRRILNVSTLNIQAVIGLSADESDELIRTLIDHCLQPQFQYIHSWKNNDIVVWDNRRTMHMAFGHPVDEIRTVQRSTIRGTTKMGRELPIDSQDISTSAITTR